jgi:hypothetical protein
MRGLMFVKYVQRLKNVQIQHAYYNLKNDLRHLDEGVDVCKICSKIKKCSNPTCIL